MRKAIFYSFLALALLVSNIGVTNAGSWSVLGEHQVSFTCGGGQYNHTMVVSAEDLSTGNFSGTGYYNLNHSYTWNLTGNVNGNNVTFTVVYTGANAGYTLHATGTINQDGSVSGTTDGNCQTFVMGAGTAENTVTRTAEITAPTAGALVSGAVNFGAYLTDDDADPVQWAVRKGTCAAGVGTVFGNVDGHSDVATINTSNLLMQTFSFTADMSSLTPGMYCFIYNPSEDSGETDIRKTVQFELIDPWVGPPTDKDECKDGGWMTFNRPVFRNQGDCVSYVQSNDNAEGNRKDNK